MTYEMRIKDTLAEGEAKGRVEGKAEGIAEEKLATAKRLLNMGLSVQDVSKGTSLSVEQVEKLKQSKNNQTIKRPNPYYHRRVLPHTAFSLPAQKISRTLPNTAVGRFPTIFI